jgi:hypothetical protein
MSNTKRDNGGGGRSCPRCIRDPARVRNWLDESGPGPSEVSRNSRIRWGNSATRFPTRSRSPSRRLVPISDKDFFHWPTQPTTCTFNLRTEYAVFKIDSRMASGLGDRPPGVEVYFSKLFDMNWKALEGFLVEFKAVGYRLKTGLCKILRDDIVLFEHSEHTLYDGNPKPDQQIPYHDCKFNPDHLLVNNSIFKSWREKSTIHIFLLVVPSPEQACLSG